MLVLRRKTDERILIGGNIAVTVVRIGRGQVRIGIEAPPELAVVREELAGRSERRGVRRESLAAHSSALTAAPPAAAACQEVS